MNQKAVVTPKGVLGSPTAVGCPVSWENCGCVSANQPSLTLGRFLHSQPKLIFTYSAAMEIFKNYILGKAFS